MLIGRVSYQKVILKCIASKVFITIVVGGYLLDVRIKLSRTMHHSGSLLFTSLVIFLSILCESLSEN